MTTAKVETVELGGGISGGSGAVFYIVTAARLHARGGNQGEGASDRRREGVGDEVVARSIGKGVVTATLITDGGSDEGIALLGTRDGA